jgi:hypothetical protein
MADAKVGSKGTEDTEEGLCARNERIISWIREQRAESQSEEDRAWAERFRRFVSDNPLQLAEDTPE